MAAASTDTQCCIAGGGPAGLMLGYLLARAGVETVVLEKHADFLRDFRGDTIHPSTMQVMHELGLLEAFLRLPHQKVRTLYGQFGQHRIRVADLSHLPVQAPYVAMMPQWDFLNFMAEEAKGFRSFKLMMQGKAQTLIEDGGRIRGVRARTAEGSLEVRADIVIAADGRHSQLRDQSGLPLEDIGAPMDVMWFRLPREPVDTDETQGRFHAGHIFVMLNRGEYWQCAFVIPKGANETIRAGGLEAFRRSVGKLVPFDAARADAIASFDDVKLLTVQINRLKQWWRPGFLCIGDAAHAMSPVGGVGVNLAVQDAVAAANVLAPAFKSRGAQPEDLAAVQRRREWPTKVTQRLQVVMQNNIIAPTLAAHGEVRPPLALRLVTRLPMLSRIPARLIGLGVRPEHVRH
jgi:2-polyprenyl-6-methoxyphenol hydroxylase-like FAD-dependent oxidoreductase